DFSFLSSERKFQAFDIMGFLRPLTGSLFLLFSSVNVLAQPATLASQAAAMPDDFQAYFFNAPLSARIMVDNRVL
ncbi:hypothetical protein, partial [Cedecea sp. USHLN005]|uniref:hypothetical protein n=1 Tax=Cedecea sp. USHLN005 TaxID=3081239 RepID=UPI003016875A